jgi:hypothetical protein
MSLRKLTLLDFYSTKKNQLKAKRKAIPLLYYLFFCKPIDPNRQGPLTTFFKN